jgi:hypothetical protein
MKATGHKIKPLTCWAIVSESGEILEDTIRTTREWSINFYMKEYWGDELSWKHQYRLGCRCIPVFIAPRDANLEGR